MGLGNRLSRLAPAARGDYKAVEVAQPRFRLGRRDRIHMMARARQMQQMMKRVMAVALVGLLAAGPALAQEAQTAPVPAPAPAAAPPPPPSTQTYAEEDVLGAAEGVFGKGAEGLAEIVRKTFKDRGQPNAYIVGREAGGAFIVGVRYGSGMLYHKVEGERKIHWTGPSVGFDIGGDGSKVFALVYNLNDTEDLYRRYPAAEGKAYLIGGFTANYLQRDNIVIVPIKLGVGWRLGLNGGYLKFSKKGKVLPF
jgi:hypothetical protein